MPKMDLERDWKQFQAVLAQWRTPRPSKEADSMRHADLGPVMLRGNTKFLQTVPIAPGKATLLELMHQSDYTALFKVVYKGQICVLKVFDPEERPKPHRYLQYEMNLFKREYNAYERIYELGLDQLRFTPEFYAPISNIRQEYYQRHLSNFADGANTLNGYIMEYIPDLVQLSPKNFTPERGQRVSEAFSRLHAAGIVHGDIAPRNILIQEGTDRVVILDFDSSQTVTMEDVPKWAARKMMFERELIDEFLGALMKDFVEGTELHTWELYNDGRHPDYTSPKQNFPKLSPKSRDLLYEGLNAKFGPLVDDY